MTGQEIPLPFTENFIEPSKAHSKLTDRLKSSIFCDIKQYNPFKDNRRFEGTFRFHLHGRRISRKEPWLAICFMLAFLLVYSSTLKMEATYSSETTVGFQRTIRRYIPEDRISRNHRHENFEPSTTD
jgi:hypothetical protein